MIVWQYFPKNKKLPDHLANVINIFEKYEHKFRSPDNTLDSNHVLAILSSDLENVGYRVEKSKQEQDRIKVPVLFGKNGRIELSFDADAYNEAVDTVLEVEAGRAVTNYQFLKDLFQACMMYDVKFFSVAVRNFYRNSKDFEKVVYFFDSLYASGRLKLPLEGVLVIGY